MPAALLALLGAGAGAVAWTSWCEQRRAIQRRRAMLDGCAALFDDARTTNAPDDFPRLSGRIDARPLRLRISLIPDSLTPRRLPQLWLVMSLPDVLDGPRLDVTARPRGDDFISAATYMRRHLQVPAWLPTDCAVRGDDEASSLLLSRLRAPLEAAFADPRIKEISVNREGVRIVYQACEGRRGAHLLLRQARFEATIDPAVVQRCRSILLDIERAAHDDALKEAA